MAKLATVACYASTILHTTLIEGRQPTYAGLAPLLCAVLLGLQQFKDYVRFEHGITSEQTAFFKCRIRLETFLVGQVINFPYKH
jgi:hypothetical protein